MLASYTCTDPEGGSGLAPENGCVGTVANGAAIDTSPGGHSISVTAADAAGNQMTSTVSYTVGESVVAVTTGAQHTCALLSDTTARCWGSNSNGQLGDGTTTTRLLPVVVRNAAGTAPLTGITQIAAGGLHTCARLSDGTARCWGLNSSGQLGDGTTTNRLLPVVVKNPTGTGALTAVTDVTTAVVFSCARMSDGTARCWGSNGNGVLGDGTSTTRLLPVVVKNSAGTGAAHGDHPGLVRGIHSCAG